MSPLIPLVTSSREIPLSLKCTACFAIQGHAAIPLIPQPFLHTAFIQNSALARTKYRPWLTKLLFWKTITEQGQLRRENKPDVKNN